MPRLELTFVLTRPATSQAGDRYEHGEKGDKDFMTIYIPQVISRGAGGIAKTAKVTIETE